MCVCVCVCVYMCVYNLSLCMCLCVFDSSYLLSVAEHMGLAGQCFSLSFLSSYTRAGDREG